LIRAAEAHPLDHGAVSTETEQSDGRSLDVPARKEKGRQLVDHGGDHGSRDECVCHLCLTTVSITVFHAYQ
jgi:hypothetical protein